MQQMISSLNPGLLAETAAAKITCAKARPRFSLRAKGGLEGLNAALGVELMPDIGQRTHGGDFEALCIGPDEWILLASDSVQLKNASASLYETCPHSLVDISAREITFEIEGAQATTLLTIGIARDLETIAPGTGRRTVFDGITVTLWRDGENQYRMDVWNSFALYVFQLLETGCRELAAEDQVHA